MKNLGMWAFVAFVGFLIGKSVQTEKRAVNDVLVKNVDALASDIFHRQRFEECLI